VGRRALLAVSLSLLGSLGACGRETSINDVSCPPEGTSLTYETFGRAFLASRCQTCHGSADRDGAPATFDFATLEAVRTHKARIFARAAADNTTMPPGPDDPAREERDKLAEWLACGAP
jgi:uncharacterized membrane protein